MKKYSFLHIIVMVVIAFSLPQAIFSMVRENTYLGSNENDLGLTGKAKEYYTKAIAGDAEAQYQLGECYYSGEDVQKDYAEAVKWYLKAAAQGHTEAEYSLGFCYYNGYGVEENNDEAFRWFKIAADKGHGSAQYYLGRCYLGGYGVEENDEEALRWFKIAAANGNSRAQYYVGRCYFRGWGVAKDETEAVRWYRMAAEQGESEAQFKLGDCYSLGWGVVKNKVEATKWFRKAAEQGDARAQYELGTAYTFGAEYGVEENEEEAIKWYKKSAEQNCASAACSLGDIYYRRGFYNQEAYTEAFKWYKKAIELDRDEEEEGDVYYSLSSLSYGEAAYNLGEMYYYGRGVEEDEEEAHSWYEEYADLCNNPSPFYGEVEPSSPENLAAHEFGLLLMSAQEGDADAQFFVGLRYVNGQGVEKNDAEAVKWFLKAAQQGHSDAQYLVGVCYNQGIGVEQNYAEARKWYEKAIQSGNVKAQEKLNGLNSALFEGFWVENALHGVQLNLEYDRSNNTISGTLYGQEEICSGNGTVKGNTLNLSCSDGYTVTCTLSGGKLKIKVKSQYSNFSATLERN